MASPPPPCPSLPGMLISLEAKVVNGMAIGMVAFYKYHNDNADDANQGGGVEPCVKPGGHLDLANL